MRKIFTSMKAIVTSVVAMAIVAGSVSCTYDDTAVWKEINKIKKEIVQLRADLDDVLSIVNGLETGDLAIRKVEQKGDGSQVITLSNGKQITIYPKGGGLADVVTTIVVDDVRYWAMYDVNGEAQAIYIGGDMVPVADLAPLTQVTDGGIEVSFDGGKTWVLTGYTESITDTIITNVEVVYSDWQTDADGNPLGLYCVVTFTDGTTMKVGMQNGKLVLTYDSLFVAYGETLPFSVNVEDAVDYIMTLPKGWECEVEHKVKDGYLYLYFTSPTLENIESGAALREGVAKLMVVFENGSSAIASIKLSTNPVKTYFTLNGVHVEVGYGTNYLLCGLTPASSYNVDTCITNCNKVLTGGTSTQVYQMSFMEETTKYVPFKELRSTALTVGNEYIFWYVVPRLDEEDNYCVLSTEFFTESYIHSSVSFKVNTPMFFDANITFKTKSCANYMLGYTLASDFDAAALAEYYTEKPDYLAATRDNMEYTGSFVELFADGASLEHDTNYVAYFIAKNSNNVYLEENVLYWEFSTKGYTRDGDIAVRVVGEPNIAYDYIELTLDTEKPHIMMYYNAMPSYMASAYPDDTYVTDMLLRDGTQVKATDEITARYSGAEMAEAITFFAVAVDADGKIGKPFKGEYTTKQISYNEDLAVTLECLEAKIDNTRIKVTCEGAQKYAYIVCQTKDDLWNSRYGGSAKKTGEYIIKNFDASDIRYTTDSRYALVDGCIVLNGLEMDAEYAVVVIAYNADGENSAAASSYFKPIANIGNVIYSDKPEWAASKPTVTILEVDDNPHLFMSFSWSCLPAPHTKIYTAAMYRDNLINEELGTNINTVEKLISEIITCCDTGGMNEQGKSFEWQESGIYVREWVEWEDTDGDNYIEEVYHREELNAPYIFFPYGSANNTFIYTTWVGEDGNFCEPFAVDPLTGEEVSLW